MSAMTLAAINTRETNSSKQHRLGTKFVDEFERVYRYAKAGASALDPGKLVVNADLDTNVTNKTIARSAAVGDLSVVVDVSGAVTANAYEDGVLTISDATGEGISYRVVGNTATSGAGEMTVSLADPIKVALTVDVSEYTLTKNDWADVVISATDQADMAVGVPNVSIAASEYGWVQTRGKCAVLADEAVTRGQALTIGTGTAGAVEAQDLAGEPQVGVASEALVDTEYRTAFLTID